MLTEKNKHDLKDKLLNDDEIKEIESYNEQTGEVTFKNKTKRTITSIITRCMGYFRPVDNYNIGKKQEFKDRKWFKEKN